VKLLTVLGARPQFIKASAVSRIVAGRSGLDELIVHTGQHHDADMSDIFFQELGLPKPAHVLGVHGGTHGEMTGRMLIALEPVFDAEMPDAVLVYGDTNSTLAGALVAAKRGIPVAHVEAGLRSFNRRMPEEINRILTDRLSHWLFTPTEAAGRQLVAEGVGPETIQFVGDVMYDVALAQGARVPAGRGWLARSPVAADQYVLATIHRAESTDDPGTLTAIVRGLELVAATMPVVWPMHPRTRTALERVGILDRLSKRVHVLSPLGYLDMVQAVRHAALIATDSGGVQKEAFFHRVPCVTLRTETEWVELIDAGWNRVCPPVDAYTIARTILGRVGTRGRAVEPYGDGRAAERIVDRLVA
jgi:UDP-GlcNAc3NAcA epimerase